MAWISPTSFVDGGSVWTSEALSYDENTGTYAYATALKSAWTDYIELEHSALTCDKVQLWVDHAIANISEIEVDVYYGLAWHNIFSGVPTWANWQEHIIGSAQSVTALKVRFYSTKASTDGCHLVEADFWEVAGGVTHYGAATLSGVGTLAGIGQGLFTGKSTLSGTGTLTAIGQRTTYGKATLSGAGTLSGIGRKILTGAATLSGTGSLAGIGRLTAVGKASLLGTGGLTAKGVITAIGKATLSGVGSLSAIGTLVSGGIIHYASAVLSGVGGLSAKGVGIFKGAATLAGEGTLKGIGHLNAVGKATLSGIGSLSAKWSDGAEVKIWRVPGRAFF